MINSNFLRYKSLRLLHKQKSIQEASEARWTLCPVEERKTKPAIFLNETLDKVRAVSSFTTFKHELRRVKGADDYQFSASLVYQLRDIQLCGGYLYKGAFKYALTWDRECLISTERVFEMNEAAIASTPYGSRFFGHWILDDLPLILQARKLSFPVKNFQHFSEHKIGYSELLDAHAYSVSKVYFKKLFLLEEGFSPNSSRQQRYNELRSSLRQNRLFSQDIDSPPLGVMVLRKSFGTPRVLVNEAEVAEYLKGIGFRIIDPYNTSAEEIVRQSLNAKIVVGVEGSQLAHCLYTVQDGGTILALQAPYRFNNVYKDFTDCMNMNYAFVVGTPVKNGFYISIKDLEKTLQLVKHKVL